MQASVRNLLLDICPPDQLSIGNAWQARLTHVGSITGFAIGSLDLNNIPLIRELGGEKFRKVCILAEIILVITVWMTCTVEEKERPQSLDRQGSGQIRQALTNIKLAIIKLPKPVRRVCFVQLFAYMAWCVLLLPIVSILTLVAGSRSYSTRRSTLAKLWLTSANMTPLSMKRPRKGTRRC
jgi:solute carrier family 45 protein 1/2/4